MKSFQPKNGGGNSSGGGRNGERSFRGEKRSNETHAATSDPDARLCRKGEGEERRFCYMGHAVMENRNGLAVSGEVTHATGTAERKAALGWTKAIGGWAQVKVRGPAKVNAAFIFGLAAYNLIRLPKLLGGPP
jgi:hypothetical protein